MKHLNNFFVAIFFFIFPFVACNKPNTCDCIKSAGKQADTTFFLDSFELLELKDNINLYLIKDTKNYVKIEAPRNLLPKITVKHTPYRVTLANENRCNWVRNLNPSINAYFHYKQFKYLEYRGAGLVKTLDTLKTDFFQVDVRDGSGTIKLKLFTNTSWFNMHTGCGDIEIDGFSGVNYIYLNGTGRVMCKDLQTGFTFINNNRTNDCYVRATKLLEAETNYVGNIYYYGTPDTLKIKIKGKGKVIKMDD